MPAAEENPLGTFLRDRRARLDPASCGFTTGRRRTPGLRREEVAQRANVSATWYTWLEQGRGGAPSLDVLDRVSRALALSAAEREHLYALAGRGAPELRAAAGEAMPAHLQSVIDAMPFSPALVKTPTWDIVGWNRAAVAVLRDWGAVPPERRNLLRLYFGDPAMPERAPNFEAVARLIVATFRRETARTGQGERAEALAAEIAAESEIFARLWRDNDVALHGDGAKLIAHHDGVLSLDYSTLTVEGRPDLAVVIYTRSTPADAERVRALVQPQAG